MAPPKTETSGSYKRIAFNSEVLHALELLARDRTTTLQKLADEAFADLLKRHQRPVGLKASLRASLLNLPANDPRQYVRKPRR